MITKPQIRIPRITIRMVQQAVAAALDCDESEMRGTQTTPHAVYRRAVAMYVARQLTRDSLSMIGRAFGHRHHSTVLHSIRQIEERIRTDRETCDVVNLLIVQLGKTEPSTAAEKIVANVRELKDAMAAIARRIDLLEAESAALLIERTIGNDANT